MIVTIHPRVADRHMTLDPNMRVVVRPLSFGRAVKIKGSQLLIAGIHTMKHAGVRILPDQNYIMPASDVVPVCYDCATFRPSTRWIHKGVDLRYVMRVQRYDKDGDPLLLVHEVAIALDDDRAWKFAERSEPHLVAIRQEWLEIHKQ